MTYNPKKPIHYQLKTKKALTLITLIICSGPASAQVPISNQNPITIDFSDFNGSGFSTTPITGQLDSNTWRITGLSDGDGAFGGTHTAGDFARGSDVEGGISTGGVYAFDISGNIAIGIQPGGSDATPGTLTLRLTNNTGSTLHGFNVSYDVFVNNDQGRANSFNFAYSANDTSYTNVQAGSVTSIEASDTNGFVNAGTLSFAISGINLDNGENFYFQWKAGDVSGSGARDEFALDNIRFNAVVPEPGTYALLSGICSLSFIILRRRK